MRPQSKRCSDMALMWLQRARTATPPLHVAAASVYGAVDAIEALLDGGADPTVPNVEGRTPRDLALENEKLYGSDVYLRMEEMQP